MRQYVVFLSVLMSVLGPTTLHAQGVFRVGAAEADITPTKPMPMWGYGARHAMLSQGTRDPLLAKAVVVEAGNSRLAIVGLDLGRSLGEPHFSRICEAVRKTAGVEHLLISGSHTHHGPVLELKDVPGQGKGRFDDAVAYVGQLEQSLIDVIQRAAGNLKDARIGWASREVEFNRNRHAQRDPKPRDRELAVIRFDDLEGHPLALVVNFAAHPTVLAGSDLRWSAEYPGAMRRTVEQTLHVPCVFMQGASGDLSIQTLPEDNLPENDPRLADEALDAQQTSLVQRVLGIGENEARKAERDRIASGHRMESVGRRLGEQVLALANECSTHVPAQPGIVGEYERMEFDSRVDFQNPLIRAGFALAFFPELAAAAIADLADNKIHAALTTVLLNDELALVGGSGEFFCDHALRLKERSYAVKTLFFGYCNGHSMYFPTIEAAAQGGYGADAKVSWVELGAGEQMMNQALIHIFSWKGKVDSR